MDLYPQSSEHGFTIVSACALPEIDGEAYVMEHDTSKAKLLYLKNDDVNKSFAIGFKTPPQDDTGVFHILEHSVLCGSRKFPVKEPFVNLLKGSMQTFLNAMTFSDKTLYPVASTNEKDLFNLMDVYLDAVFHPQIYQKRAIFEQEGWHYEFDPSPDDGNDATLIYNGVVYNEMKGALSDPSSVLYDRLQQTLFPNTCYAFESGGDPKSIPTLTYENYLDEHGRHYRTDNSYIILYGNLDINRALDFLDKNYLAPLALEQDHRNAQRKAEGELELAPRNIAHQAPVRTDYSAYKMITSPENALAGYAVVIGDYTQHERVIATDILLDALLGSNEAPLKRALLKRGVAQDISVNCGDPVLQPFVTLELQRPAPDVARTLKDILCEETKTILEDGLDKELIEAALSHAEFIMREHEFGTADGVIYSMQCLNGWLYGGDAVEYLRYEDIYKHLHQNVNTKYFEELLRSLFVNPNHYAVVEIVPTIQEGPDRQAQELAEYAATLNAEEIESIRKDVEDLRHFQETPDSAEALATLPRLSLAELDEAPQEPRYGLTDDTPFPCLYHQMNTHGIAYAYQYFPLDSLSFEDLPYVTVLALVLGKLDTQEHSASQIDTLTQARLGNLSFYVEIYEDKSDPTILKPYFVTSGSALSHNTHYLASLPQEIMMRTRFDDTNKILDILKQRKIALEQAFLTNGHSCAVARARSYTVPAGVLSEQLGNVGFYQWLCDLINRYHGQSADLARKLSCVAESIFRDDQSVLSFAGSSSDYDAYWDAQPGCGMKGIPDSNLNVPTPTIKHEAFIIPSDVSYSALSWDRRLLDKKYEGSWLVAARALSYDYLWTEVRVKGGAYGVGFQAARKGSLNFYSYRDPHIDETIQRFLTSAHWLEGVKPSQEELDGFIVATIASLDAPIKPRALLRRQDGDYFSGYTYIDRLGIREEALHTTTEDLHGFARIITDVAKNDARCTFSAQTIINRSQLEWDTVDLIK